MLVVPSGGAAVSATVANGAGASTKTVAAGSYYLTAAGGVSGLLATLQDALNDGTGGYPQTAAAMAAAVGYGTWSSGWLFNIASGNDTGAFGGVTLTAAGTPIYGIAGPRGGIDLAIDIDGAADQFTGGNNFNVTGTDDLCVAWVAKFTGAAAADEFLFVKGNSGAARWGIYRNAAGNVILEITSASGTKTAFVSATSTFGSWHVGMAVIDRGGGAGRVGICALDGSASVGSTTTLFAETTSNADNFTVMNRNAASPALTTNLAAAYIGTGASAAQSMSANLSTALTNFKNAINAAWSVSLGSDGRVSIGWTGYATPTWSLSWTSTTLRDVLGFTANISGVTTTQTGTAQAKGVVYMDCPLNLEGDPAQAPLVTDLRTSQSPTGVVLGLVGNSFYRHRNIVWSHVPRSQVWESAATYDNGSWETFFNDTQLGFGPSWFTPSSPIQIYYQSGASTALLGGDANGGAGLSGWTIVGVGSIEPRKSIDQWTGLFRIEIPTLVSSG